MGFNPWLVALLAAGPLLILVVGLAAAAEGLGSQTVWILIGAIAVAGAWPPTRRSTPPGRRDWTRVDRGQRRMRLHILSDLHLGVCPMDRPLNDSDIVILGDIGSPRPAVAWALRFDRPVLYVPGNHEFYGSTIDEVVDELKGLCAGTHVKVLHDEEAIIGRVRFVGTPLWTNFGLFGEGTAREAAKEVARRELRDFSRIRIGTRPEDRSFTPDDCAERFARHAAWLDRRLSVPHDGPTVVITHHAFSPRSIHPRFAGSLLNACFVSDAEYLAMRHRPELWIHGHTHDSFDYRLHGTRVVCNPRGYAKAGVNENPLFDPAFCVDV
jgi:predicted phosphodiesterase